ncbi:hypothetical protein GCM10010530_54380 [Kribbella aluminosa]
MRCRAEVARHCYAAFRKLLITTPSISAPDLYARLAEPRRRYLQAYGRCATGRYLQWCRRACDGSRGIRLPLNNDRTLGPRRRLVPGSEQCRSRLSCRRQRASAAVWIATSSSFVRIRIRVRGPLTDASIRYLEKAAW